jgi:dihydrofolate synthase/folylpolyglutamate synthase
VLLGPHQIENGGAAVAALRYLGFDEAACAAALARAEWPARLQRLSHGPLAAMAADADLQLWLDGSHNEAAARVIAQHFAEVARHSPAPLHLICGMLETKNTAAFFAHMADVAQGVQCVTIPEAAASLPAEALAATATAAGLNAAAAPDLTAALRAALAATGPGGRVLICGSLYLAGVILRENG